MYRLERDISRVEQQLHHNLTPRLPAPRELSAEEFEAQQDAARRQAEIDRRLAAEHVNAAAEQRRKEGAWAKYFTPRQRCQIPESQRMVEVCQANEAKLRARFEAEWTNGKRT